MPYRAEHFGNIAAANSQFFVTGTQRLPNWIRGGGGSTWPECRLSTKVVSFRTFFPQRQGRYVDECAFIVIATTRSKSTAEWSTAFGAANWSVFAWRKSLARGSLREIWRVSRGGVAGWGPDDMRSDDGTLVTPLLQSATNRQSALPSDAKGNSLANTRSTAGVWSRQLLRALCRNILQLHEPFKMQRFRTRLALLCGLQIFCMSIGVAQAQSNTASASALLSDRFALLRWLESRQPEMAVQASRGREAAAATKEAGLIPNPLLTVGAAGFTFGHRNPSNLSFTDTPNFQVTVAETVEIGKRSHRINAAIRHAEAIEHDASYNRGLLVADARESLAKLVYLQALRSALEVRLKSAYGVVGLDKTRLEHGDVSGIDHHRLELEVLNVKRELSDNASELTLAQAQCSAILAAPCVADVEVSTLEQSLPHPELPSGRAFDPAKRPDVRAQRSEAEAALEQATLYKNRRIPDPQVGVGYLYDRLTYAGNQPHSFGVFVTMPLPLSDNGEHQRTQALERAQQAELRAKRLELAAKSEAQNLFASEILTTQKLELLRVEALPLGTKVLTATESAYRLGQVSLTDLLLARRQQAELLLDLVETYYALFQTRSQIYRVLGLDAREGSQP